MDVTDFINEMLTTCVRFTQKIHKETFEKIHQELLTVCDQCVDCKKALTDEYYFMEFMNDGIRVCMNCHQLALISCKDKERLKALGEDWEYIYVPDYPVHFLKDTFEYIQELRQKNT